VTGAGRPTRADRLAGALLGQALGDALGFVVEAEPPEAAAAYVRDSLQSGRAGERGHPSFPFGQYTDDTQLARELLLSVRETGTWSPPAFAERIATLVRDRRDVGAGEGTRAAARRLLAGASWRDAATPAPYAGNGSAMRVGPIGVLFDGDASGMRRAAAEQSRITHADPRCAAAAVAVAGTVSLASAPGPLDARALLSTVAGWADAEDRSMADAVAGVADWLDASPEEAARRLQLAGLDPHHAVEWRGISAFVVPSVAWSLYAFLRSPDDYWATVCTAIAVGGDTDTMAAMAGAMAGARLGPAVLPGHLLDRLTDQGTWGAAELAALAEDCARLFTPSVPSC
jgi:ADP-ribosylglycohydrolase